MIVSLGPHAWFVVASYATALVIILGLILWVVADHRTQRRTLAALETRGIRRRSAPTSAADHVEETAA